MQASRHIKWMRHVTRMNTSCFDKAFLLQCVAVCCIVLQFLVVRCIVPHWWMRYDLTWHLLQCVAVCSMLQRVAPCCSVVQCFTVCNSELQCAAMCCSVLQCVAVCCSALQCVAMCCSVLQCVAVCCSVLPYVAVCCSVLQCVCVGVSYSAQCVAVICSVFYSIWHQAPPRKKIKQQILMKEDRTPL